VSPVGKLFGQCRVRFHPGLHFGLRDCSVQRVEVVANESTLIVAVSGAGALSTNQKGSFGLAGAVTVNYIATRLSPISTIQRWRTSDADRPERGDREDHWDRRSLSGATKGTGIAGSVGVNLIFGDTDAYVDSGSVITDATSVSITAKDTSSIIAVAGALAYGGKAGVGAGVAVNIIDGSNRCVCGRLRCHHRRKPHIER